MTRFFPGRARRRVPAAAAPSARSVVGMAQGKRARAPRRRLAAACSCTRPTGPARRSSARRPRAARRRCSTCARARSTTCAPTCARSLRSRPDAGTRPAQARRADRRGTVKAPPPGRRRHAGGRWRRRRPRLRPLHARAAARCSSGRRPACRSTTYPNDLLRDDAARRDPSARSTAPPPPGAASATPCTYLDIMVSYVDRADAARDRTTGTTWSSSAPSNWCKLTANGTCDTAVVYDPAALALTSVSASTSVGRSSATPTSRSTPSNFSWADLVAHPRPARQRAVVPRPPERGDARDGAPHRPRPHLLLPGTRAPLERTTAHPIPDCASASPDVLATTMFPSADPGDVDKRTLAPDDQQAVCEIYPAAQDPNDVHAAGIDDAGRRRLLVVRGRRTPDAGRRMIAARSPSCCWRRAPGGAAADAVRRAGMRAGSSRAGRGVRRDRHWRSRRRPTSGSGTTATSPEYWQASCIPVTVYPNGFTDMTRDEVAKSIGAAAHTWSPARGHLPRRRSHPFLEIVTSIAPADELPPAPAVRWTQHAGVLSLTVPGCEDSGISIRAVALTSTWSRADGHIVDADVRINANGQLLRRTSIRASSQRRNGQFPFDLQNASHTSSATCSASATPAGQPVQRRGTPDRRSGSRRSPSAVTARPTRSGRR